MKIDSMKKLYFYGSINLYKSNISIQKKAVAIFYFRCGHFNFVYKKKYKVSFIKDNNQLERGPKSS
ncbi:hypothetical protein A7T52_22690 [Salmonella enterica subsp. diarizonae serovar 60:r:e,n,x,z15]|uniref:Uncharacterized protein n=1 Tax=Salmonella enterica I TaxID=59201 RepID=A0A658B2X0_SALET|nr:hypothetical protein [Salmonella enterica]ESJ14036.1 hypothetical protein SED60170_24425 [Salmonella enterica subsp. diarizonae serovar 60:r:e,n,x,z15 str. 01-0170]OHF62128.1 hypothetical protein A7S96_21505 [Salmonella enterica subsp. diarizonae serovar 60:r:e,n,x,z15]PUF02546.1 hypothetical protein DAX90_22760 [Salmonella enterica subsp. enterica]EAU4594651.1 hypothetical protein [Salmonella enterica]